MSTSKACSKCRQVGELSSNGWCKPCNAANAKSIYAAWTPAQRRKQNFRISRNRYGFDLTLEAYEKLLATQGGVCAICGKTCPTGRHLAVDHCHRTSVVRGLLCNKCNRALGYLNDDSNLLRAAANYLERSAASTQLGS